MTDNPTPLTLAEAKDILLALTAQIEGIHALIFGTHELGDTEFSHNRLADGGEIHELVHNTLRMLPGKDRLQLTPEELP